MPVGKLRGWREVFADDFTTDVPTGGFSHCDWGGNIDKSTCAGLPPVVAAKWWAYPDGWPDTRRTGRYYPTTVLSIHNGMLDFDLHTAKHIHMVAAAVPKIPALDHNGLHYGAYVVRFRADSIYGYKTSWLLWPDNPTGFPRDGEIDFPEGDINSHFTAFMHWMHATHLGEQDRYESGANFAHWNTAVIEWAPHLCRFILNGRIIGTSTTHVPSDPMHWVLQTETSTWPGEVPHDAEVGHVYVDWVAAYAYSPGPPARSTMSSQHRAPRRASKH